MATFSSAAITTAKCRHLHSANSPAMFNSQHTEDTYRGSQSVSAFQTTFYSAVPLPDMHADADVFQMLVPSYRRRYRHHAVLDCFNIPPTTANDLSERHHAYMDLSSNAVVGNKRCPTVDERENEGQDLVRQRRRQRWRQDLASRAAVLLQAVEGAFFPGSIVALLLTLFGPSRVRFSQVRLWLYS